MIRPKAVNLKRRVGFGTMNCAVRITVGEDVVLSKIVEDRKDQPAVWHEAMFANLVTSLQKGKLEIVNVSGNSE